MRGMTVCAYAFLGFNFALLYSGQKYIYVHTDVLRVLYARETRRACIRATNCAGKRETGQPGSAIGVISGRCFFRAHRRM